MATNHTTNYQLCQWEATDKVLRTDFNEDNAKIDAALSALAAASRFVVLADQTVETAADSVSIDLSDVDFLDYLDLRLWVEAAGGKELGLRVNEQSGGYYQYSDYGTLYSPIYLSLLK